MSDGELDRIGNNRLALGQALLFYSSFEGGVRFGRCSSLSLFYQHSSNGPLSGPNQGIDNFGVRYGYHFGERSGQSACR